MLTAMLKSRTFSLLLLCCVFSIAALAQREPPPLSPECATACILKQTELPPDCDCKTIEAAIAAAPSSGAPSFPDGFPSPSDLVYEAKAQYDARMADIENYYFVERSFIIPPAGFTMPGFFQVPAVVPTMPVLRFFTGELGPDGEKRFKEVPPGELARQEAEQQGGDAAALGADPAATMGAFADAFGVLANGMPNNGAGGLAGGAAEFMSGVMKDMQAGLADQQASEDGFGGNGQSDGIGMAIERELLTDFSAGDESMSLYSARYSPAANPRYYLYPAPPYPVRWEVNTACLSHNCGATQERVKEIIDFIRYVRRYGHETLEGYVLRLDARNNPREIFWNGRTFRLQYAELWLMSVNGGLAILGEEEELVTARRRLEYVEYDGTLGVAIGEQVVIDSYSEGFEERGGLLAPRVITQNMEMGNTKMRTKRLLSRFKSNEGPPTQAEIAKLIADAMQDDFSNDPLLDEELIPTYQSSGNGSQAPMTQEPSANPATGQAPLIQPGQGTPAVRDNIPIIPRQND